MKKILPLLFTLMSATCLWATAGLDITEVMYNPPNLGMLGGCPGDFCEYIEITNNTGGNINLNGYKITNLSVTLTLGGITLAPGEQMIVTGDVTSFNTAYAVPGGTIVIGGLPPLNNGGWQIQLTPPGPPNTIPCADVFWNPLAPPGTLDNGGGLAICYDIINPFGISCIPSPAGGTPLPIELLYFKAEVDNSSVMLEWVTITETNNDYFTLESSTDGKVFNEITRIVGAGTSAEEVYYSYIHHNPIEGTNYYRLKQTDFDGTFSYSEVVTVKIGKSRDISISPNAVKDMINIRLTEGYERDIELELFNLMGSKILDGVLPARSLHHVVEIAHLQPGHYLVRLNVQSKSEVLRFVKL